MHASQENPIFIEMSDGQEFTHKFLNKYLSSPSIKQLEHFDSDSHSLHGGIQSIH